MEQRYRPDDTSQVEKITSALLDGLETILDQKLYGLYIYGAVVFPETKFTGDIDFHAVLTSPLTDAEKIEIDTLHKRLAAYFGPLGEELDGYYLLLEDATRRAPPRSQMWSGAVDHSWALHREHMRTGRCFVLHGPDPREIYPSAEWSELEEALQGELDYVRRHLEIYPAYCTLNLCRLMYSFSSHDVVVSKTASAKWAEVAYPEWEPIINSAERIYEGRDTDSDKQLLASRISDFYKFADRRIRDLYV